MYIPLIIAGVKFVQGAIFFPIQDGNMILSRFYGFSLPSWMSILCYCLPPEINSYILILNLISSFCISATSMIKYEEHVL